MAENLLQTVDQAVDVDDRPTQQPFKLGNATVVISAPFVAAVGKYKGRV